MMHWPAIILAHSGNLFLLKYTSFNALHAPFRDCKAPQKQHADILHVSNVPILCTVHTQQFDAETADLIQKLEYINTR